MPIRYCQIAKIYNPDKDNMDNVNQDSMASWQVIIRKGGPPSSESVKANDIGNFSHILYQITLCKMFKPIFDELEMSGIVLTEFDESRLGKNPDLVVLCNIIQGRLPLNTLKHVIVEKVLSHAISNKECQCQDKGEQLLLYVRKEGKVGKSRVVEIIHLGFSLLK